MKDTIKKILNRLTSRSNIGTDLPSFRRINLKKVSPFSVRMVDNFELGPGDSPYQLYAFLSTLFDDKIILDIGSQCGNSALSLSYNESNHVRSYEIDSGHPDIEYCQHTIRRDNITWRDYDFREDENRDGECQIDYDKVAIILIDIDPHGWKGKDGKEEELKMIEFLLKKGWSGVIILDDIYKGCQMQDFWNELSIPGWTKIDVTELGHSSGTGILFPS